MIHVPTAKLKILCFVVLCVFSASFGYAFVELYGDAYKRVVYDSYVFYMGKDNPALTNKTQLEVQKDAEEIVYTAIEQWFQNVKAEIPALLQDLIISSTGSEDLQPVTIREFLSIVRTKIEFLPMGEEKANYITQTMSFLNKMITQGHTYAANRFDQINLAKGNGNCVSRGTLYNALANQAGIHAVVAVLSYQEMRNYVKRVGRDDVGPEEGHFLVVCEDGKGAYALWDIGVFDAHTEFQNVVIGNDEFPIDGIPSDVITPETDSLSSAYFFHGCACKHDVLGDIIDKITGFSNESSQDVRKSAESFRLAVEDLNRAIELGATCAQTYSLRGTVYMKMSDFDKGIDDLEMAIRLDPGNPNLVLELARAYCKRGDRLYKQGNFDLAVMDYTKAIESCPSVWEDVNCMRSSAYMALGDFDRAIMDLEQVIGYHPGHLNASSKLVLAYNKRGKMLYEQGRLDLDISDCTKKIISDPGNAENHYNLAIAYVMQKKYSLANVYFSKAIDLGKTSAKWALIGYSIKRYTWDILVWLPTKIYEGLVSLCKNISSVENGSLTKNQSDTKFLSSGYDVRVLGPSREYIF